MTEVKVSPDSLVQAFVLLTTELRCQGKGEGAESFLQGGSWKTFWRRWDLTWMDVGKDIPGRADQMDKSEAA